jgi:NADH:ubiquinone oxidoreductase subunit 5 (subunit L)/multisubunit Na+/H+ antiporter MnhA subunit
MGAAKIFKVIDTVVVDGSLNGLGKLTLSMSRKMKNAQSGQIQHYAMYMVAGFIALIIIVMVLP